MLPALLLSACRKDEPEIDFGPDGGFQYRTRQNIPGPGDATDWTADGPWNSKEKGLFSSLNLSLDEAQQSRTWYSSVYPNPSEAADGFTFMTSVSSNNPAPAGSRKAYVIVDRRYNVLQRGDINATTHEDVVFGPNSLPAGSLYRLYYVCYVPGQRVYFRSHGDIKVE
ncbi:hypothetical protein GCM10023185_04940 [Hymenobacter saemangeumensis]|uniref:Lipoprotein n=2 Tax=Hymenobacter saemangeumensis TaxID=1084522 RepID=A0ABP8I0S4_9BACT